MLEYAPESQLIHEEPGRTVSGDAVLVDETPASGTRMTVREREEPARFSEVAAPALARALWRANWEALAQLSQVLDGDGGVVAPPPAP